MIARLTYAVLSKTTHDTLERPPRAHRRLLARRELPVGRPDLSARQSAAARAAARWQHVKPRAARTLGHDARAELHLRAPEPGHQEVRPRHDLRLRPRSRRTGAWSRNTYLEGTYSEIYPDITPRRGRACRSCSGSSRFPAAFRATSRRKRPARSTKAASWATRSATRSARCSTIPISIVACVVGDGEAETGPLATAWHSNKFLNPVTDGAVLPILHLNGYKIANPTVLARIAREELEQLLRGYGWTPYFVEGDEPASMHAADGRDARRGGRARSDASSSDARGDGAITRDRAGR